MLHSTFKSMGDHGAHGHSAEPVKVHIIERSAAYTHTSSLGWMHFHMEPNFRKKPLGWKAYSAQNLDVFAPFHVGLPRRHAEKAVFPGLWSGWGHMNARHFGWCNIKVARKWWMAGWFPFAVALFLFWYRIGYKQNWETKNKGAVSGME